MLPLPSSAMLVGVLKPLPRGITLLSAATISSTALLPESATKMLPLASTATAWGPLKPLPSVVIAQLKCAVCALAEGANPPSALTHRSTKARAHLPQRTQFSVCGSLSECRLPGAAARLTLEITWEVARDERH